VGGLGATKARKLIYRETFWVDGGNQIWRNKELLRIWRGKSSSWWSNCILYNYM